MFSDVLLTVDYDRTLTAPDSSIPKRNLEAIEYFMAHGGTFTMNTGRSIPMSQGNILGIVPTNAPLLLYNGSADFDAATGSFTRTAPIDLDPRVVLPKLQQRFPQLHLEVQAVDAHYLLHRDEGWERYCENNRCPWGYAPVEQIPGPFLKFSLYGQFRQPTVASMFETSPEEEALFQSVIAYLDEHYGDKITQFRAAPRILDIHAAGVSKGKAARALQKKLGKKHLVCVGDAENDIAMLENADFPFCPADGIIADRFPNVCPCAEGAIADVIYEKIPNL